MLEEIYERPIEEVKNELLGFYALFFTKENELYHRQKQIKSFPILTEDETNRMKFLVDKILLMSTKMEAEKFRQHFNSEDWELFRFQILRLMDFLSHIQLLGHVTCLFPKPAFSHVRVSTLLLHSTHNVHSENHL